MSQRAFEEVIGECGKEGAKQFRFMREALLPALHLRKPDPDKRLQDYSVRPDATWQLLREIFPERYREQTADWRELEQKVRDGTMKPPAPMAGPQPPAPPPLPAIAGEEVPPNLLPQAEDIAARKQAVATFRSESVAPNKPPAGG